MDLKWEHNGLWWLNLHSICFDPRYLLLSDWHTVSFVSLVLYKLINLFLSCSKTTNENYVTIGHIHPASFPIQFFLLRRARPVPDGAGGRGRAANVDLNWTLRSAIFLLLYPYFFWFASYLIINCRPHSFFVGTAWKERIREMRKNLFFLPARWGNIC